MAHNIWDTHASCCESDAELEHDMRLLGGLLRVEKVIFGVWLGKCGRLLMENWKKFGSFLGNVYVKKKFIILEILVSSVKLLEKNLIITVKLSLLGYIWSLQKILLRKKFVFSDFFLIFILLVKLGLLGKIRSSW